MNSLSRFICDLKIKWHFYTCIIEHLAGSLLRHWTRPIVHNKPVTPSAWWRFSRFENIFLASRWNFFRARKNTLLAESQTGMWSNVLSAKSKRRAGSSLQRIAESFENSKVVENEARKPMPIGSSRLVYNRNRPFRNAFSKNESRNAAIGSAWRKTCLNEGDGKQTLGRFSSSKQTD